MQRLIGGADPKLESSSDPPWDFGLENGNAM